MLKKIVLSLCMVLLLLCSCGKTAGKEEVPTVPEQFEGELEVVYGDNAIKGFMRKLTAGSCTFEVSEPEALKGLKVSIEGEEIILNYMGINYTIPNEKLPQAGKIADMSEVMDHLSGMTVDSKKYDPEQKCITDSIQGMDFKAYFDDTGVLNKIEFTS